MDYAKLKAEITNDPLAIGYASMTDDQICTSLNSKTRSRHVALLTPSQVLNAIVYSEWTPKTTTQQQVIWNMLGMGAINPWGVEANIFTTVFGAASATIAALAALRVETISRAEELGLETVYVGHIIDARAHNGG
jgi:hypothetical protein